MNEICIDRTTSNNFKRPSSTLSLSMREIKKQRKLLRIYKDRVFIMTILCKKSESFYNTVNTLFIVILILTSTLLAVSNSYHFEDKHMNENFRILGIFLNSINVLIVSFNSQLKIGERASEFKIKTQTFNKLAHEIEMLFIGDVVDTISVQNIIARYDIIVDNTDSFPGYIKKSVSNKYKEDYNMPVTVISPHKRNSENDSNNTTPPIQDLEEMFHIQNERNMERNIENDIEITTHSEPNRKRFNSISISPLNSI